MSNKIPCSVGILTLNSGKTLRRCLESLKNVAEIVICDGNSTDDTVSIAREYGAKVVKQYDSDEPNLRCVKDKANVRERNMQTSTYDWYFFMDSDDALSSEVEGEIKSIVENPNPEYLIYRMPTRLFLGGREVKYEATYPSYQTRLVNKKVDAHFKGKVHERLIFDQEKFKVGTMKSYYDFHWDEARYKNIWKYQKMYANWEVEVMDPSGPWNSFLYWGVYYRVRIIAGYLYRIPVMYIKYGFKESMSPKIQFFIMWYHVYLLWLFIKKRLTHKTP